MMISMRTSFLVRLILCFCLVLGGADAVLADGNIFGDFCRNMQVKLFGRTINYFSEIKDGTDVDDFQFVVDGRLELTSGFSLGNHLFGISGWVEYGSQEDTYSQKDYKFGIGRASPDIQRMRRIFELNELYLVFSLGDFDITLGRRVNNLGLAPHYSPPDRISPVDFNDPLDIKKFGQWQFTLEYYKDATTFSISIFPFFHPPEIPSMRSRWISTMISGGLLFPRDFQFFDQPFDPSQSIDQDIPEGADEIQGLLGLKTTVQGWDLFFHVFNGVSVYPVLRAGDPTKGETSIVREYIRAATASFGFSTAISNFEVHAEGIFQKSYDKKDDDFLAFVYGMTYTPHNLALKLGLERIELTVDLAGDLVLSKQNQVGYIQSSQVMRSGKKNILILALIEVTPKFALEFVSNLDFYDNGRIFVPGFRYRLWKGFWFKVHPQIFQGAEDSNYGRWKENNRIIVSFEYSFF